MVARSQKVFVVIIAADVIEPPLTGALDISLAPCAVPIEAETELAKVGVSVTVAPYGGLIEEATIESVTAETTVTVVVADLPESSLDVAAIVTLPEFAGAVHAPVAAFMVPALADQAIPFVTPPVILVLNVVELLTVRVGVAGAIALTTTVCGVTVTEMSL